MRESRWEKSNVAYKRPDVNASFVFFCSLLFLSLPLSFTVALLSPSVSRFPWATLVLELAPHPRYSDLASEESENYSLLDAE